MEREKFIRKYLEFFKSKGHQEIQNSSLIPENDPSVLFTTAGMHPLTPYLLGQKHPFGKRLCNVQRCIRTTDIEKVGDSYHHTFLEMLGNWSLGDYWKKEAIEFTFEFLTKILKIPLEKLSVTCFKGNKNSPKDTESAEVWSSLGIKKERIAYLSEDNWWGPAGETGPCGPCTEIFYWTGKTKPPAKFNPNDKKGVEIGNDVLMEYNKTKIKAILVDAISCLFDEKRKINKKLLEMLLSYNLQLIIVTNVDLKDIINKPIIDIIGQNISVFTIKNNPNKTNPQYFKELLREYNLNPNEIIYFDHSKENINSAEKIGINSELYKNLNQIKKFIDENLYYFMPSKQKNIDFGGGVERTLTILNGLEDDYLSECFKPIIEKIEHLSKKSYEENKKTMRIIADHIKAAVFVIADGIVPSNTEQGYVLRRLIRRAVINLRKLGFIGTDIINPIAEKVFDIYPDYKHLQKKKDIIYREIKKEEEKFEQTLDKGLNLFNKLSNKKTLSGKNIFLLYQSYGFPIEMTKEMAKEKGVEIDEKGFEEEQKKHQELSKTATKGRFKSGLADSSIATTRLHTAAHLLLSAIRKILKDENINQKGSNITQERLRLDFSFSRKLTDEEVKKIEDLVNEKINESINVIKEEMPLDDAKKQGALGIFEEKYGKKVSVYTIGNFSKEICTGPHVKNTSELGHFKIIKEESCGAGTRRIRAVLE